MHQRDRSGGFLFAEIGGEGGRGGGAVQPDLEAPRFPKGTVSVLPHESPSSEVLFLQARGAQRPSRSRSTVLLCLHPLGDVGKAGLEELSSTGGTTPPLFPPPPLPPALCCCFLFR